MQGSRLLSKSSRFVVFYAGVAKDFEVSSGKLINVAQADTFCPTEKLLLKNRAQLPECRLQDFSCACLPRTRDRISDCYSLRLRFRRLAFAPGTGRILGFTLTKTLFLLGLFPTPCTGTLADCGAYPEHSEST